MDTISEIENSRIKYLNIIDKIFGIRNIPLVISCSPPGDNRCEVCRRHISELEPYGENGEPLEKDFSGKYFVGRIRPFVYDRPELPTIFYHKESDIEHLNAYSRKKCGKDISVFYFAFSKNILRYKSRECRECILLNTDEYIEKIFG
jgi:hypothetical protein